MAALATGSGSRANGEKTIAASGGYVKGSSRPPRVSNIAPSAYSDFPSSQARPPIR